MKTINIIGAGIAGSIMARLLRRDGYECRVIDDKDSRSASQASSNLYVASWMKKFVDKGAANGIKIVEELFADVIDTPFSGGIAAAAKVKHIAQRHLLVEPDVIGLTLKVDMQGCDVRVGNETVRYDGPTILCCGYRQHELTGTNAAAVWVKVGHCFLFEGELAPGQSRLAIVSPYTHEKLYQFEPGKIYYADSVAVKMEVYQKRGAELKDRTLARARKLIGERPILEHRVGYRPFVDGHDFGYASRVWPGVWTLNGGGKNGIVAYANAASKIVAEIKEIYAR